MLVNFSNHRSDMWSKSQLEAAGVWGKIVDVPFPRVPADASEEIISKYAEEFTSKIVELEPDVVMCQGEFTLAFSVVQKLKEKGILVVAACSERIVKEVKNDDTIEKTAVFRFRRFRYY